MVRRTQELAERAAQEAERVARRGNQILTLVKRTPPGVKVAAVLAGLVVTALLNSPAVAVSSPVDLVMEPWEFLL